LIGSMWVVILLLVFYACIAGIKSTSKDNGIQCFTPEPAIEKKKLAFIHFNHTSPLLWDKQAQKELFQAGFSLAGEGMVIGL